MTPSATSRARLALAAGLLLWGAVGFAPASRPDPAPATAPKSQFSALRALAAVNAIAERPHPIGSADHDRVRDFIRSEFARLGVMTVTQTGVSTYHKRTGKVENILARLPGTASTRPVMLVAHYDSTPRGPGAGDDAHAVAVLLETLRALRTGPALRNDLIFLVTDGEEAGLLGAALFMHEHPWRYEPGVVLNFEARGTGGQAFMFETSTRNEWLVRNLQAAVPEANATSLAYEVYKRMPNDTDLTVFKIGGLAGMNFAFIEHPEWYHHPEDDPKHLDLSSVQEQGNYALALARRFGGQDLAPAHRGDAVYFPTRLTSLIVYPAGLALPLAWLTLAALLLAALAGIRRRASGVWLVALLAIPALLQLMVARAAPGVTYALEWPLFGGVLAYGICMTASEPIGLDWRLALLCLAPTTSFLVIAPMLHLFTVALGPATGGKLAVVGGLFLFLTVLPQLLLIFRRTRA